MHRARDRVAEAGPGVDFMESTIVVVPVVMASTQPCRAAA